MWSPLSRERRAGSPRRTTARACPATARARPRPVPNSAAPPLLDSSEGRLQIELVAAPGVRLAGRDTRALGFNGTSPGPTLRVRPGDELAVRLTNRLDQPTNLHTHGLRVSPQGNSDNPFLRVDPGTSFDYLIRVPTDHPRAPTGITPTTTARSPTRSPAGSPERSSWTAARPCPWPRTACCSSATSPSTPPAPRSPRARSSACRAARVRWCWSTANTSPPSPPSPRRRSGGGSSTPAWPGCCPCAWRATRSCRSPTTAPTCPRRPAAIASSWPPAAARTCSSPRPGPAGSRSSPTPTTAAPWAA